jgi:hypothetical protein
VQEATTQAVTIPPMSRLFESFEFLDRGWDIRALENQSLRSVFLWLLPLLLLLGADIVIEAYVNFRLHRFNWPIVFNLAVVGCLLFATRELFITGFLADLSRRRMLEPVTDAPN